MQKQFSSFTDEYNFLEFLDRYYRQELNKVDDMVDEVNRHITKKSFKYQTLEVDTYMDVLNRKYQELHVHLYNELKAIKSRKDEIYPYLSEESNDDE